MNIGDLTTSHMPSKLLQHKNAVLYIIFRHTNLTACCNQLPPAKLTTGAQLK